MLHILCITVYNLCHYTMEYKAITIVYNSILNYINNMVLLTTIGMVRTNLGRFAPLWQRILYIPLSYFLRSPEKGAETIVYMIESKELESVSGKYFYDCKEIEASKQAQSVDLAEKTWAETHALLGINPELEL